MTLRDIKVRSDDKCTRCFSCRLLTSALSLFFKFNVFGLLKRIYFLPSIIYTVTIVASPAVQIKPCTEYNNTNGYNYRFSLSTESRRFDFGFTDASANIEHTRCIQFYQSPLILTELFQHNLINVSYLTACYLYQVMMTLHFLNDVANDAESTQK